MSPSNASDETGPSASPNYAFGQIARALATEQDHPDAETRERASRRVTDWLGVLGGMLSGALRVGSRTPVAGAPAWVTTRVVQGGFATGERLAGGPLLPHEARILGRVPQADAESGRGVLNAHFLSEDGLAELVDMLDSGRYRIAIPEEGALLTVAWLATNGQADAAREILDEIAPHFDTLRFYPVPVPEPLSSDVTTVRLRDAGDVIRSLRSAGVSHDVSQQTEALAVWHPHQDRVVALLAETVAGEPPTLVSQEADGRSVVTGGWPFAVYPAGWADRARALLAEYEQLRASAPVSTKPHDPSDNPTRLREVLTVAADDPARLTGREVGRVRAALAQIAAKRGRPDSARLDRLRTEQARVAALPTKADWAEALAERLGEAPEMGGLTPQQAETALGTLPPAAERYGFRLAVLRAVDATPEQHVAWGTLTSSEMLARIVPPLAARARSAGLADPALRRLDEAVYAAFRRRRSVLLLNLASQVKVDELPWMRAIEPMRGTGARTAAQDALAHVVTLALTSFPWQILPNKLLQDIRALARAAELDLPIVDEIAADIFMGTFTETYLRASQAAGRLLHGSLYARYYRIDYAAIEALGDVQRPEQGASTSPGFDRLCHQRAGQPMPSRTVWSGISGNGAVIEQEQVLTTHNLAVLFETLGLRDVLAERLGDMARRTFSWTSDTLERITPQGRYRAFRSAAYAWRNLVFFLSQMPADEVAAFSEWARAELAGRSEPLASTLGLVVSDLLDASDADDRVVTTFYGWVTGSNALLDALAPRPDATRADTT